MQEILKLNAKNLRTGRTRSQFTDDGIWDSAQGLNPYIEDASYRGLIACTAAPTDITTLGGTTLADIPIAWTKNEINSTYNLYILGDQGHFYDINGGLGLSAMTDRRSGTPISSPANGLGIIQPRGGSAVLLYATKTRIGTWDLSGTYPTGWNDGAYDCGTSTPHRPFHRLFDRLYYGNASYVGQFADNGDTTITHTAQALDLDGRDTATALGDDGRFLIIATARIVQDDYNGYNATKVIFWDTSASSWSWETTVPNETSIRSIVRTESGVLLFGKYGIYTVAFGQHAKRVLPLDPSESIAFDALNYGHVQSAAPWGDGAIFGKLGTAYSKFLPGEQRILYNPLQGFTGDIGLIIPDFLENKVIVGTRTPKLYSFDMTAAGNVGVGGNSFISRYIDLEGYWHVQGATVTFPNGVSGTSSFFVTGAGGGVSKNFSITSSTYPNKRVVNLPFSKNITDTHVRINLGMTEGAPAISEITLWGEPATP
jgi:hypothetical protein